MIKHLKPSLIPILHPLLNICKYKGYHPKIWKTVFALLFNKPNKPRSNPSNYRPISLISHLSKILERIITTQIYHWAETNNILNKEQPGFRKNKSTTDKLFQLTQTISQTKNQRTPSSAIFLDVEKAFDKVWHDGLIHKLLFLNTPPHLRYINNYISNRSMFFAINNTLHHTQLWSSPRELHQSNPIHHLRFRPTLTQTRLQGSPFPICSRHLRLHLRQTHMIVPAKRHRYIFLVNATPPRKTSNTSQSTTQTYQFTTKQNKESYSIHHTHSKHTST